MMKKVLDSSTEKYILTETPKNHIKQLDGILLLDFKK